MGDDEVSIPGWVVSLVGRLVLEREAAEQRLAALTPPPPSQPAEEAPWQQ